MRDIKASEAPLPILCTIPHAAALIGRCQTWIYGAIGDGTIEAVKSDKRTLIVVESLVRYAKSLPPAVIKPQPPRRRKGVKNPPRPPTLGDLGR
jgi:hypothetical protein